METHNFPADPPQRPPAVTALLWLAKLGAAGILGFAAYEKLTNAPHEVKLFAELDWEPFGRYLIGGIEIVAAILIIIPQSAIFGAFLGLGIMLGAVIGHLTVESEVIGLHNLWKPLMVAGLCVVILYIRRHDAKFIRNLFGR